MHAITTRGIVSSRSLPDSPSRCGSLPRGGCSMVGWSSVTDTLSAFAGLPLGTCDPLPRMVKLRIANVSRYPDLRREHRNGYPHTQKHRKNQHILAKNYNSKKRAQITSER